MARTLLIVLDPQNNDPTWGDADEAILCMSEEEPPVGEPLEIGDNTRISIYDLIEAARDVVNASPAGRQFSILELAEVLERIGE